MKLNKLKFLFTLAFVLVLAVPVFQGCKISYSFTGASIAPSVKTFTVYYIPNRARLINPNLSQQLTEALQDKLTRQTSLSLLEDSGDLEFEGTITGYDIRPMNIKEGDTAAQNRLTVTVKIKYTNNKNHDDDWEKSFSSYVDYDSTQLLSDVEESLMEEVLEQLTDDIFNASIANW
ncbi:LptE family protein [Mangrovibacterium lignilyticum]|uniref:LptE family protein n=1 Tax=Mangrovibacterium lignilyticum TaxID=2668052 RepID=UPI0013D5903E|nr:LptE family protein [Mangrovibacterium lignilyticum]